MQWDFTKVEMRNQAYKKIVAEKPILARRSASACQLEIEIERELELHDKTMSCPEHEYTCSLIVACTSCSTMKVGISCMNTVKVSCHGRKIASRKFRR